MPKSGFVSSFIKDEVIWKENMNIKITKSQLMSDRIFVFRIILFLLAIILMANLNALVDLVLHPEIPFFDKEHLVVGGVTSFLIAILLIGLEVYTRRLESALHKHEQAEEELKKYRHRLEELVEERSTELKNINEQLQQDIAERKSAEEELHQRLEELERFRVATIQREFRMKELKDRVKQLEEELGRKKMEEQI